ncbi:MAG: zinc ribbon domain-containing protein [Thermodesulfobacteriota bacterium]
MPIYEYRCEACGKTTSALIMKREEEREVTCRHCGGRRLGRVLSRCVVHKSEAGRVQEFDARKPRGDDYYRDDRNVGLWTRKRMKELGVDLGGRLDEIVEKAHEGKFLDDL